MLSCSASLLDRTTQRTRRVGVSRKKKEIRELLMLADQNHRGDDIFEIQSLKQHLQGTTAAMALIGYRPSDNQGTGPETLLDNLYFESPKKNDQENNQESDQKNRIKLGPKQDLLVQVDRDRADLYISSIKRRSNTKGEWPSQKQVRAQPQPQLHLDGSEARQQWNKNVNTVLTQANKVQLLHPELSKQDDENDYDSDEEQDYYFDD